MEYRHVDLSHPLDASTPPFPGDPPLVVEVLDSTGSSSGAPGEHVNLSRIHLTVHCGTHVDAPFHFHGKGATVERLAPEIFVGPAVKITLPEGASPILAEHLRPHEAEIRETGRVILETGWSRRWRQPDYFTGHPVLDPGAARFLVEAGCRLVGIDAPSVDQAPHASHLELLGGGVVILENLTALEEIGGPRFELIALPLALRGLDGSPVRALARIPEPTPE